MDFTANQWAIVALVLVLGWLLGMLSRSGGARWKRAYEEERIAHAAAEERLSVAQARVVELERDVAARPIGPTTATAIGVAASGERDDLALIRGIGRGGENQLNDIGIFRYRQLAGLSDSDTALLEDRLGIRSGTIANEEWREQAALLRDHRTGEHLTRYAAA